jgi:HSP20 family protein
MFTLRSFPTWGFRSPFNQLDYLRREMDRLSDIMNRGTPFRAYESTGVFPAVNLTEDASNYYVRAELPGIKADSFDIQAVGKTLTISGERKISSEGENVRYHRREREAGKFSRAITLPGEIDIDKIEAKMTNGLLTIRVPRAEAAKPKQISVK